MNKKPEEKKGAGTKPLRTMVRKVAQENTDRASFEKKEEIPEPEKQEEIQISERELNARHSFKNIHAPIAPVPHLYGDQETRDI